MAIQRGVERAIRTAGQLHGDDRRAYEAAKAKGRGQGFMRNFQRQAGETQQGMREEAERAGLIPAIRQQRSSQGSMEPQTVDLSNDVAPSSAPTMPPIFSPGMAQGFRQPWAPGTGLSPQAVNTLKDAGLGWRGPVGSPASNPGRPTFGAPYPGFRDNMYLVGRDGPALAEMGKIPALPSRSQTSSPGIGLDGKRINYGRR